MKRFQTSLRVTPAKLFIHKHHGLVIRIAVHPHRFLDEREIPCEVRFSTGLGFEDMVVSHEAE
jgi:hypothetical protein